MWKEASIPLCTQKGRQMSGVCRRMRRYYHLSGDRRQGFLVHERAGFWTEEYTRQFLDILNEAYGKPETADKMWENIYLENIERLPMRLKKCDGSHIYEFDSLEELGEFDGAYKEHSGSYIMEYIAETLGCREGDIHGINPAKNGDGSVSGIQFLAPGGAYRYDYAAKSIVRYAMQGSCRS